MTIPESTRQLIATVDARELQTQMWGPLRAMFPTFVEEIELGRYLKRLLAHDTPQAVVVEPHRDADGRASSHVFDVYRWPAAEQSS